MKKLNIIMLFVLLLVTTLVSAQITVKFKAPASWTKVSLYTWGPEALGGWPGAALTLTDGWYSYTFDAAFTGANLIFNNGGDGEQTVSLNVTSDMCLQSPDVKNAGGIEYDLNAVACSEGGIVVRVHKPTAWNGIYIYAYYAVGETTFQPVGGWPGTALTETDGWYSYTFDGAINGVNVIFNNPDADEKLTDTYVESSTCFNFGDYDAENGMYALVATDCTTALSDVENDALVIYPNPVKESLKVSIAENSATLTIVNETGQTLINLSAVPTDGVVDVSSLQSGVYFITVAYSDGQQKTEKFIKL
ncbi:MAG TPA: starch-binding protein [Bacteroidales bacterium]